MGDKRSKVGTFLSSQPPLSLWPVASVSLRRNRADRRRTDEGRVSLLHDAEESKSTSSLLAEKHEPDSPTRWRERCHVLYFFLVTEEH